MPEFIGPFEGKTRKGGINSKPTRPPPPPPKAQGAPQSEKDEKIARLEAALNRLGGSPPPFPATFASLAEAQEKKIGELEAELHQYHATPFAEACKEAAGYKERAEVAELALAKAEAALHEEEAEIVRRMLQLEEEAKVSAQCIVDLKADIGTLQRVNAEDRQAATNERISWKMNDERRQECVAELQRDRDEARESLRLMIGERDKDRQRLENTIQSEIEATQHAGERLKRAQKAEAERDEARTAQQAEHELVIEKHNAWSQACEERDEARRDRDEAHIRLTQLEDDLWVRTRCSREKKVDATCTVCPWLTLCRVLRGEGD